MISVLTRQNEVLLHLKIRSTDAENMVKTRKKSSNSAFAFPTPFSPAMIPSKAYVVRHMQFLRQEQTTKRNAKLSAKECQRIALNDLQNIWAFSFPTISYEGICLKVERLMESASKLNKFLLKEEPMKVFSNALPQAYSNALPCIKNARKTSL